MHRLLQQLLLLLLPMLLLLQPSAVHSSRAKVQFNDRRPANPDVIIDTDRYETSYEGPVHPFKGSLSIYDTSLKLLIFGGETQCYYYVLVDGYQMHLYLHTLSTRSDDVFDVFISDGDGNHLESFIYKSQVSHQMNVTKTDTYEICVYNPLGMKMLSFSTFHYSPDLHAKDFEKVMKLENVSISATESMNEVELNIAKSLSMIRNKPQAALDLLVLEESNSRVQQKALLIIFLMLASAAGTTLFIRRLFREPLSRTGV